MRNNVAVRRDVEDEPPSQGRGPFDNRESRSERVAPRVSVRSAISGFHFPGRHERVQSSESPVLSRRGDPLGLTLVYEPAGPPLADIILVHGLGGSSRHTWCKNKDLGLFWPKEWLPQEPDMSNVRISTFGYNSHFSSTGQRDNILSITDFAKRLLSAMKFSLEGSEQATKMGQVPTIFVAHSMGGLVVKKAYLLGQRDRNYADIISAMKAIVFLSTPHRGTQLAAVLNRVLSVCITTLSPKHYLAEVNSHSQTLEDINEEFRNIVDNLKIFSMYETQHTSIGPSKVMVLQKDTSVLGYPDEVSTPLDADHHDVCKFINAQDPNYISVRNVLVHLVREHQQTPDKALESNLDDQMDDVERCLGSIQPLIEDFKFFLDKKQESSCEWMLEHDTFIDFVEDTSAASKILWYSGPPGFGKSVLSCFLIDHFSRCEAKLGFYIFRFGEENKNSLLTAISAIAYQFAACLTDFRERLHSLVRQGFVPARMTPRTLWEKVFSKCLYRVSRPEPVYLILDGLDECNDATALLKLLSDLRSSLIPLRIIVMSRQTQSLLVSFEKLAKIVAVSPLSLNAIDTDIRAYVEDKMVDMHGQSSFKSHIVDALLAKASGNFLWVRLVAEEILHCNTLDEVQETLDSVPADLVDYYYRMDDKLCRDLRRGDQALSRSILSWVTCARRAMSTEELSDALQPEYAQILDIRFTVAKVCGEFVVMDQRGTVSMVHLTAKDFLMSSSDSNFYVPAAETHHKLFMKCLDALLAYDSRALRGQAKARMFLFYAAASWPFHLDVSVDCDPQQALIVLGKFFGARTVLTWMHLLCQAKDLKVLVKASTVIGRLLTIADKLDDQRSPLMHRLQEKELLGLWKTDLIRIVGKFGPQLLAHPTLIYQLIPPFCPPDSVIHKQFCSNTDSRLLNVVGFSKGSWDDLVAKFSIPDKALPSRVICIGRHFAVLLSDGAVVFYHADTFEEVMRFYHGERVLAWCINQTGDKMATCGMSQTKVWNTATGQELHNVHHIGRLKILSITFSDRDQAILVCADDRSVRRAWLEPQEERHLSAFGTSSVSATSTLISPSSDEQDDKDNTVGWQILENCLGSDTEDRKKLASPRCVEFSPDGTQVAVSYRWMPVTVWSTEEPLPRHIKKCPISGHMQDVRNEMSSDVPSMSWNPATGHLIGMLRAARCVFKWHPLEGEYLESAMVPVGNVLCSPDGKFFISSGQDGSIRLWDFMHFTVIYQLSCNVPVNGMAIDPIDSRIYDVREGFCNVWRPNSLLRLWDAGDRDSESQSNTESTKASTTFTEATYNLSEMVTSLALNLEDLSYAVANQGTITEPATLTHFSNEGNEMRSLGEVFVAAKHLCWSDDGQTIACADLARQVIIRRISPLESPLPVDVLLTIKTKDSISQVLLSPNGKCVLVAAGASVNIWSIPKKSILSTRTLDTSHHWICSISRPAQLVGFAPKSLYLTTWEDTEPGKYVVLDDEAEALERSLASMKLETVKSFPIQPAPSAARSTVTKVVQSLDGMVGILVVSQPTATLRERRFLLVNLEDVNVTSTIHAQPLTPALAASMLLPLGFVNAEALHSSSRRTSSLHSYVERRLSRPKSATLSRTLSPPFRRPDRNLAFLDRDYWVCTYALVGEPEEARVKRHYFLPRDWLNADLLELAIMRPDGALLCPKNGEVAVVMHGLGEEWVE